MSRCKKPLSRSITIGCAAFIIILCVLLGIQSYISSSRILYERYESYITDIINFNLGGLDVDKLKEAADTQTETEEYLMMRDFMDAQMENFSIHYLYIVKPLNTNKTGNVMSIISAEDNYNRYVDTEGNLYLGEVLDDEYDPETVQQLFDIMNGDEIVFFKEKTEWSLDYTGAISLKDSSGAPFAVLCVDVDVSDIRRQALRITMLDFLIIALVGVLSTGVFLWWARKNVTDPVKALEESVSDFADHSHGQRDIRNLQYNPPTIKSENEIKSLSDAMQTMAIDMQSYVLELVLAEDKAEDMQHEAAKMSELATRDVLTGIRNKNAYQNEIIKLKADLSVADVQFGIAVIDMNCLKTINDTYGHEKGDIAIKQLCRIVCVTFEHSPVFRIGGDEFVVILKGRDYENYESLVTDFNGVIAASEADETIEPWLRISAAIGVAFYDHSTDSTVDDVFERADHAMYQRKNEMKAGR